jgi:transposase
MIALNSHTRVFVCKEPTDIRASYDSLCLKVKSLLEQDPFSGHVFVFINRRRTSVKCLCYDGTGLVLVCKRMEQGTFSRINPLYKREIKLTASEFSLFLEGASFEKRFIDSPSPVARGKKAPCRNGSDLQETRI